jgi:hypothetical protein
MMLQQKSTMRRTVRKGVSNPVLPDSRPNDLRSPVESLLRDVAFALHATSVVRRDMEAEQVISSTAS